MSSPINKSVAAAAAEVPSEAVVAPSGIQVPSPSGHQPSSPRSSTPAPLLDLNLDEVDLSFELAEDEEDRRKLALARHSKGPDAQRLHRQAAQAEVSRAVQQARQEIPR